MFATFDKIVIILEWLVVVAVVLGWRGVRELLPLWPPHSDRL